MFSSVAPFGLIFACGVRQGSNFILLHADIHFPPSIVCRRDRPFPLSGAVTLAGDLTSGLVPELPSVLFVQVSVCAGTALFCLLTLEYVLKSGSVRPPPLLFLFKIVLVNQGRLRFRMNFRIFFSLFVKCAVGILIVIVVNLQIALDSIVILL